MDWWALGILVFEMLAGYPPFYDENPFGIYEKILLGRLVFPAHFDSASRDLIKKLLTAGNISYWISFTSSNSHSISFFHYYYYYTF